jgi:hypothetical protein
MQNNVVEKIDLSLENLIQECQNYYSTTTITKDSLTTDFTGQGASVYYLFNYLELKFRISFSKFDFKKYFFTSLLKIIQVQPTTNEKFDNKRFV